MTVCDDILLGMKKSPTIRERFVKEHNLLLKVAAGQIAAIPFIGNFLGYPENSGYIATGWIIVFSLVLFFFLLLGKFLGKNILVPFVGTVMLFTLLGSPILLGYVLLKIT